MQTSEWTTLGICILAALLHGLSGFGFPMMSTAVLSNQYPLSVAVTIVIIPCLALNLLMLNADPQYRFLNSIQYYLKAYWPLILSSLVGSLIGVQLLLWLNEGYLKLLLGAVIIFYVFDQFRTQPFQTGQGVLSMLCFGLLAGIIGGATNAMAPFLMMYLLSRQLSKVDIVIISNLSFVASKIIQLFLLFPVLISISIEQKYLVIWITLFALVGVWIGSKIRHHLSQRHFKILVLIALFGLGIQALWQSIGLLEHSHLLFK